MCKMSVVFLLIFLVFGCGESEKSKKNRALSQVGQIADRLSQSIGDDGYFKRESVDEVDPWGEQIWVRYHKVDAREYLTVTSNGPDRLPFTRDDIGVVYQLESDKVREEISRRRKEGVDIYSQKLTHGLTKGILDALKERKK